MYSYSQNFEDVYIYRAFKDVAHGFYIDAGAYDPIVDSVTKLFYDLGWSGINLEPGPSFATFETRVRDINLAIALGPADGETVFRYRPSDPGTSTISPSDHRSSGSDSVNYVVPMRQLSSIIGDYAAGRHVHFLKIDVEGAEWDIITATDWRNIRPELIVIESTKPYSNVRRDGDWGAYFERYDYLEVFFDGINTYYLRRESLGRAAAFSCPINVLDAFRKFDLEAVEAQERGRSDGRMVADEQIAAIRAELTTAKAGRVNDLERYRDSLSWLRSMVCQALERAGIVTQPAGQQGDSAEAILAEAGASLELLGNRPALVSISLQQQLQAIEEDKAVLAQRLSVSERAGDRLDRARRRLEFSARSRSRVTAISIALSVALSERTARGRDEERKSLIRERAEREAEKLDVEVEHWRDRNAIELKRLMLERAFASVEKDLMEQVEEARRTCERLAREIGLVRARAVRAETELKGELDALRSSWREPVDQPRRRNALRRLLRPQRTLVRRAEERRDAGRYLEAAGLYESAVRLDPDMLLCISAGDMWKEGGSFSRAEQAYRHGLTLAPGNRDILLRLASLYEQALREAAAQAAYAEAGAAVGEPDAAVGGSR